MHDRLRVLVARGHAVVESGVRDGSAAMIQMKSPTFCLSDAAILVYLYPTFVLPARGRCQSLEFVWVWDSCSQVLWINKSWRKTTIKQLTSLMS